MSFLEKKHATLFQMTYLKGTQMSSSSPNVFPSHSVIYVYAWYNLEIKVLLHDFFLSLLFFLW